MTPPIWTAFWTHWLRGWRQMARWMSEAAPRPAPRLIPLRAEPLKPGDPAASYLVARMASTEPGIAMPELGRSVTHDEAIALVSQWIGEMK